VKEPPSVASLRVLEEDPPVRKAGGVLVRSRASSLNPHYDFVVRGLSPAADGSPGQLAKATGARVIATSSSEEKLEKPERLGAVDLNIAGKRRTGE
jgi:NADPH:quinone reductase-like Zn-dependent oxidoreductase